MKYLILLFLIGCGRESNKSAPSSIVEPWSEQETTDTIDGCIETADETISNIDTSTKYCTCITNEVKNTWAYNDFVENEEKYSKIALKNKGEECYEAAL